MALKFAELEELEAKISESRKALDEVMGKSKLSDSVKTKATKTVESKSSANNSVSRMRPRQNTVWTDSSRSQLHRRKSHHEAPSLLATTKSRSVSSQRRSSSHHHASQSRSLKLPSKSSKSRSLRQLRRKLGRRLRRRMRTGTGRRWTGTRRSRASMRSFEVILRAQPRRRVDDNMRIVMVRTA